MTIREGEQWELLADYYVGFIRGLETFSQLLEREEREEGKVVMRDRPILIDDQPEFVWRGLMIDTARHYLPVPFIKKIINGLMFSKLNILHWHAVDQDSFPIFIPSRPDLSGFASLSGTYSPQ